MSVYVYVGCRHATHHTSHITTELFMSAKEPYISAKEPYISAQEPYQPRGVTIARALSHARALSLSFLLGHPLVFSLARSLVLSLPIVANPHAEL